MSTTPYRFSPEQALPHAPPMILIDRIEHFETDQIETSVIIRDSSPFFRSEGMPAHVILEYMAQTCGAMVGVEALLAGRQPRVGLLLGTRNFHALRAWLAKGEVIVISASVMYRDGEMGVFNCEASIGNEDLATAQVTVYQPPEGGGEGPKNG